MYLHISIFKLNQCKKHVVLHCHGVNVTILWWVIAPVSTLHPCSCSSLVTCSSSSRSQHTCRRSVNHRCLFNPPEDSSWCQMIQASWYCWLHQRVPAVSSIFKKKCFQWKFWWLTYVSLHLFSPASPHACLIKLFLLCIKDWLPSAFWIPLKTREFVPSQWISVYESRESTFIDQSEDSNISSKFLINFSSTWTFFLGGRHFVAFRNLLFLLCGSDHWGFIVRDGDVARCRKAAKRIFVCHIFQSLTLLQTIRPLCDDKRITIFLVWTHQVSTVTDNKQTQTTIALALIKAGMDRSLLPLMTSDKGRGANEPKGGRREVCIISQSDTVGSIHRSLSFQT